MNRLTVLVLAGALAGCGALRRPDPVPDTSQDGRIRQEVEARLGGEPALRAGPIRVQVHGGTVMLYGAVHGMGAWQCALANAELVSGVRTVVDFLVLERGPRDVRCLAPREAPGGEGADPRPPTG